MSRQAYQLQTAFPCSVNFPLTQFNSPPGFICSTDKTPVFPNQLGHMKCMWIYIIIYSLEQILQYSVRFKFRNNNYIMTFSTFVLTILSHGDNLRCKFKGGTKLVRALLVVHVKTESKGGPHSRPTREDVRVFLFFNDLSAPTEKQHSAGTEQEGDVPQ